MKIGDIVQFPEVTPQLIKDYENDIYIGWASPMKEYSSLFGIIETVIDNNIVYVKGLFPIKNNADWTWRSKDLKVVKSVTKLKESGIK